MRKRIRVNVVLMLACHFFGAHLTSCSDQSLSPQELLRRQNDLRSACISTAIWNDHKIEAEYIPADVIVARAFVRNEHQKDIDLRQNLDEQKKTAHFIVTITRNIGSRDQETTSILERELVNGNIEMYGQDTALGTAPSIVQKERRGTDALHFNMVFPAHIAFDGFYLKFSTLPQIPILEFDSDAIKKLPNLKTTEA